MGVSRYREQLREAAMGTPFEVRLRHLFLQAAVRRYNDTPDTMSRVVHRPESVTMRSISHNYHCLSQVPGLREHLRQVFRALSDAVERKDLETERRVSRNRPMEPREGPLRTGR